MTSIRAIFAAAPSERLIPDEVKMNQLRKWARPDTSLSMAQCQWGPESVECMFDAALIAPSVLAEAIRAEREGMDAILITCVDDPGLYEAREAVRIPVVGAGHASMLAALNVGERFSFIAPLKNSFLRKRKNAELYGLGARLASIRALEVPVFEIDPDNPRVLERAVEVGRMCVELDGADVILLGCGRLADVHLALQEGIGVPVIDPRGPAVHMAEMLAHLRVNNSSRCYMPPPAKNRVDRRPG